MHDAPARGVHNRLVDLWIVEEQLQRFEGWLTALRAVPTIRHLRERVEAIDPVCAMTVTIDPSAQSYDLDGIAYYFCCAGCRTAFANDPASYLTEASS